MTPEILTISTVIGLVALAVLLVGVARAIPVKIDQPLPLAHPSPESESTYVEMIAISARVERLEQDNENLKLAIDEGIKRVDRAEKRIQKTVTSARRLVRENSLEHPGIEAEFEELHTSDVERSDQNPVLPLYEAVEAPTRTGIPGLNSDELNQIRERLHGT